MSHTLHKHQLEQQLRASEARFRTLIANSSDSLVVIDATGHVMYASPSAQRSFQPNAGDGTADPFAQSIAPEDQTMWAEAMRDIQQQPGAQRTVAECRVRTDDGEWRTFSAVITNLLNDPTVNGIVINAHDITPQKQARDMLERLFVAEQRHARELAALHTAFRTMSSSLELKQVLANVLAELKHLINAEAASVLLCEGQELVFAAASGLAADELTGAHMPIGAGIAGATLRSRAPTLVVNARSDDRFYTAIDDKTGQKTQSLIAVPLLVNQLPIGVMEAINKTGGQFDAHDLDLMQAMASSAAIAIDNARVYEALREHARRLQAAQPRLIQTEKMAALGRLTASIAHEINNPLQVVQGCLSLIRDQFAEPDLGRLSKLEIARQDLDMAEREVDRLAGLIHRLHSFYQPARVAAEAIDVNVLVEHVLTLTEQQIEANHISVDRRLELSRIPSCPRVTANPDHLTQVLLNLILNAVDAMPDGGQLLLRTALDERHAPDREPTGPWVRIDIGDTGRPIPADQLRYAFEPFQEIRPTDSSLSVSICYELITSIGGEIVVASEDGVGTTFTLWLPAH